MNTRAWHHVGPAIVAILLIHATVATASNSANSVIVVSSHLEEESKGQRGTMDGLSTLVRFHDKVTLFYNGGENTTLVQNLEQLRLDPTGISAVVLSQGQTDLFSGLPGVLSAIASQIPVYVPAPAAEKIAHQNPGATVVAVSRPLSVQPDAWLVGPIQSEYKGDTTTEQALVLDQEDGLVVIVGCSHPGIVTVVERVKTTFGYRKIKLVVGGFHLQGIPKNDIKEISLGMQQMGVETLAVSEGVGKAALKIFREEWGDRLAAFDFGDTVEF